jgi:hypothetical protein
VRNRFFTIDHYDALRFRRVPVMLWLVLLVVFFVMVMLGRANNFVVMLVETDIAARDSDAVWPGMGIRSRNTRDRE